MKKSLFLLTSVLAIAVTQAKAVTFSDTPGIISFSELSLEKMQEFIKSEDSGSIIEFKEGTSIPIQFLTKNRVCSVLLDPNLTLSVDKTCYLRIVNSKCYMSEDCINWKKARDFMTGEATAVQLNLSSNKPGIVLESNVRSAEEDIQE
jgi:hypothetical protein